MEYQVYETILARRSIRRYLDKAVTTEQINILLHAAMAAPSACNLQPWAFIVVDDPLTLQKVKKTASQGQYNAPLAIVVCGINKHIPWKDESWRQDCGGAAQNIMLTCVELGLASVCLGGFDEDSLSAVLEIPHDVFPMCILLIGYPASSLPPKSWYTEEAVHYQKYDSMKPRTFRTLKMLQEDIDAGIIK